MNEDETMSLPVGRRRALVGVTLLLGALALTVLASAPGEAAKRTFARKGCVDCHKDFEEKYLSLKHVHPVVKELKCEECHLPHGLVAKLLLKENGNKLCSLCHSEKDLNLDQPGVHTALRKGKCTTCHDPHGSNNQFLLSAQGSEICFKCHEKEPFTRPMVHTIIKNEGCRACHKAHASSEKNLLTEEPRKLCLSCHDSGAAGFRKVHGDYPVAKQPCTVCHDPHSSEQANLLKASVHPPVAGAECDGCHNPPDAPEPFGLA